MIVCPIRHNIFLYEVMAITAHWESVGIITPDAIFLEGSLSSSDWDRPQFCLIRIYSNSAAFSGIWQEEKNSWKVKHIQF